VETCALARFQESIKKSPSLRVTGFRKKKRPTSAPFFFVDFSAPPFWVCGRVTLSRLRCNPFFWTLCPIFAKRKTYWKDVCQQKATRYQEARPSCAECPPRSWIRENLSSGFVEAQIWDQGQLRHFYLSKLLSLPG